MSNIVFDVAEPEEHGSDPGGATHFYAATTMSVRPANETAEAGLPVFLMIRHTVVFRLKHAAGSPAERDFLAAAQALEAIPGVQRFEVLRQIGMKNAYTFGISMEFRDAEAYARYNKHSDHVRFVQQRWLAEVAEFLEIDYAPYRRES